MITKEKHLRSSVDDIPNVNPSQLFDGVTKYFYQLEDGISPIINCLNAYVPRWNEINRGSEAYPLNSTIFTDNNNTELNGLYIYQSNSYLIFINGILYAVGQADNKLLNKLKSAYANNDIHNVTN